MEKIIKETIRKSLKNIIKENNSGFDSSYSKLIEACEDILDVEREKLKNKEYFYNKIQSLFRNYNEVIMSSGYNFSSIGANYNYGQFSIVYLISGSESWDDDTMYDNEAELVSNLERNNFGIRVDFYRGNNNIVEIILSCDLDED
jgi:hypothetical protein